MRHVQRYSKTLKESILIKALAPNGKNIIELAEEFNMPHTTIRGWISAMKKNNQYSPIVANSRPKDRTAEFKLQAVIDSMSMTDNELGAYCRKNGIYTFNLDDWKKTILAGLSNASSKKEEVEQREAKEKIKKLEGDLNRKDKALAEVSALLILKKKADLLWGEVEDD